MEKARSISGDLQAQERSLVELNSRLEKRRADIEDRASHIKHNRQYYNSSASASPRFELEELATIAPGSDEALRDREFESIEEGTQALVKDVDRQMDADEKEISRLHLEEKVLGEKCMEPKSRERLLKAKLNTALQDWSLLAEKYAELERNHHNAMADKKKLSDSLKKQEKGAQAATAKLAQLEQKSHEDCDHASTVKKELDEARKEIAVSKRLVKQLELENKAKESKLNRALAVTHRIKSQVKSKSSSQEASTASLRSDLQKFEDDNKKLHRQKRELLVIVKKQSKLISTLKRQKMHLEAAQLLSFTEEEFKRALDLHQP